MGSGQSTRKLTISNEEEIGVIKVSNAVVERLAQGSNKVPTDTIKDNRKEQELQVQNQYWQRRLQDMEKKHLLIDRILEEEYKKTIDEFSSGKVIGQKMEDNLSDEQLCTAGKEKIIKCYQENPKEILNCSDLVEEFSNCVDQRRVNLITTRC
ncbi:MICOS complex subunit mic25-a isoform X2 [Vespula pensylvanica]|uniref:MICOS complex subunit mic25-a isoform X2 n=1 Tax=Vespula pensylvanica TaxID=30213 RepID=UPI001CBA4180|nr:MICOS complex subunit mic25-a isoform X2 [Vespula pensylvanica]